MFDFPNPPITTGTVVTTPSGGALQWDGSKWGPVTSGVWVDAPADGSTYGRRNNAWNSVDAMVAPMTHNVGRNAVHNPYFNIWQRGGTFTNFNGYGPDRWQINTNTDTSTFTSATLADADRTQIGDESAAYALQCAFTGTSGAANRTSIYHFIENVRRLANQPITLSFWARCTSGALRLGVNTVQNFGTGGTPSSGTWLTSYTPTLSTTWARYSVTWQNPSLAGKTLGTNNDHSTWIAFYYSAGTNYTMFPNVGIQSGTILIWGVQLEIGPTMTPLEKIDPQIDVTNCQRFYCVGNYHWAGYQAAGVAVSTPIYFPVTMRSTPAVAYSGFGFSNCGSLTQWSYGPQWIAIQATVTATGPASYDGAWSASADL